MTLQERRLKALTNALEQIDRDTASGEVVYTPELDSARAQLVDEIRDLAEQLGRGEPA